MLELKGKRVSLGLTQKQIAKIIGVSETQFQQWEYGNTVPSFLNARKWATSLGIDMNTFSDMYIK